MAGRRRGCCCGCEEGCVVGSVIEATLIGVDAGLCDNCFSNISNDYKYSDLLVDGVYNIGGFAFRPDPNDCLCVDNDIDGMSGFLTVYNSSDDSCSGGVSGSDVLEPGFLSAIYDSVNSRFKNANIVVQSTNVFSYSQAIHGGSYDFGDEIPNGNSCGSVGSTSIEPMSSTGTLTINCT